MELKKDSFPTRDSALIGAAGVHFVVSELSMRGLIALPTIRNTAGVDVVVTDKKGTWQANLQVKTSRSKVSFWPIGKRYNEWVGPNNYYVFLRYNDKVKSFEVFLESSQRVAELVDLLLEQEKQRNCKEWAPCYYPKSLLETLRNQWQNFSP
jgi:hypothetical protein